MKNIRFNLHAEFQSEYFVVNTLIFVKVRKYQDRVFRSFRGRNYLELKILDFFSHLLMAKFSTKQNRIFHCPYG
jgi:hypothetical protein